MDRKIKDVIEFPDSTANCSVKFSERDMKFLDESEGKETTILLSTLSRVAPAWTGFISLVFGVFLHEWQKLHASNLTRNSRASFNYKNLLAKDVNYIPYYTMGWLFGERYKGFVLPCTGDIDDDRTPNEPEAMSPERLVPPDPKLFTERKPWVS